MSPPKTQDEVAVAPDASELELAQRDTSPFLVTFEEPFDAENPLDWPTARKWMVTDVLSATGFNRIMVSTIMAPALPTIARELNMSPTESAMSLSIYLLATAFGPLIIGPLSEMYGRQVVLHGSSVWFLVWNLVCGFANTKGTLIASRFLAGFGASAIYALAGGVLSDIWRPEQRGKSLGVYLVVPLLGAAVGPIIGGFIAERTTWRWMFWSTSVFQTVMIFVSFFSFPESYGTLILRRRAASIRKQTGNDQYYTVAEQLDGDRKTIHVLMQALTRPLRLLMFHPIIQLSALLSGFDYGILYVVLSTFSNLWTSNYHESVEISGLHYIACSLGELLGSQFGGPVMDYLYRRRSTQTPTPESRLPLMFPALIAAWCGMLMYGWTANYRVHWAVVDVAVVIMMFGMQMLSMPMTAYVLDTYGAHTSSAMAALQFARSLTAFLFPLFAPSMYRALGYGWANSLMALVGFALTIPLPIILTTWGPRLRAKATSTY
ncbi:putative efflux pump antibiotic resistance protein [Polychaeton citri CBS 116435]|uniref:Efflux pump antibiotic resistance protein n=1 Tax=Polychaeton citri CBS 116435 TaxID=1314669 RepID=A0A9P4QG53_9PEZI|nr:putative efflux pump antibiotic resistance protein [Polychaeton citri CBS 116435]